MEPCRRGHGHARLAGVAVPCAAARAVRGRGGRGGVLPPPPTLRIAPHRRLPPPCAAVPSPSDTPSPASGPRSLAQRLAAVAAAALVAGGALLSGGDASSAAQQPPPPPPSLTATTASLAEDALLSAVRTAQAAGDAAVNSVLLGGAASTAGGGGDGDTDPAAAAARALLEEVHEVVSQNYVDVRGRGFDRARWDAALASALHPPPRDLAAARRAVRAMLAFGLRGDPYTRYADPAEFAAMARFDLSGVGLNLGSGDEFLRKVGAPPSPAAAAAPPALPGSPPPGGVWVVGLVGGSPAAVAGAGQGDRVLGVGGEALPLAEPPGGAAARIRSAAEAAGRVDVDVAHPDGQRVRLGVTLPQQKADAAPPPPAPSPVSYRTEAGGRLGVIRLTSFTATARADTVAALHKLTSGPHPVSELALDLRGNRGGLVSEGVAVAALFLPPGAPVAITKGASPAAERTLSAPAARAPALAPPPPEAATLPLSVWVDGRTASAAEIAAGGLRANCRAVLVGGRKGARTYGKGLIQSVYGLGDGSGLVLTVGKYLTPARADIDGAGLAADVGGAGKRGGGQDGGAAAAEGVLAACRRERAP